MVFCCWIHTTCGLAIKHKWGMLSKAQFCLWKHWHLPKRRQDLVFSWHYLVLVPGPGRTGNGQKTEWWRQPPFAQKTWVNENKSKGFTVREIRIWLFSVCSLEIQRISKIHLFLKRKKKSNSLSLNHLRNFFMGLLNKFPPLPVITFFHFFASEVSNFFSKGEYYFLHLTDEKSKIKRLAFGHTELQSWDSNRDLFTELFYRH